MKTQPVTTRCTVHDYPSTASWFELIGICHCLTVVCVTESDGYHAHEYRLGDPAWSRIVVTEHLHTWMPEHLAAWPNARPVTIDRAKTASTWADTLADAWQQLADAHTLMPAAIPASTCAQQAQPHEARA